MYVGHFKFMSGSFESIQGSFDHTVSRILTTSIVLQCVAVCCSALQCSSEHIEASFGV